MARWPDQPNGARSSFSFLLGPAPHLDNEYTIFGKVVGGLEVLDLIEHKQRLFQESSRVAHPEKPLSEGDPEIRVKEINIISE
jgi:cyclophilin family peptidyl-prolyl cis-trans isomerase